jgi:hypothetical protein
LGDQFVFSFEFRFLIWELARGTEQQRETGTPHAPDCGVDDVDEDPQKQDDSNN